jgi:EAL and modified HD-GYP domain-containing signal transduction protein
MNNRHVLLARQPIYNQALEISAYELLFRSADTGNSASFSDGDKATSQVLLNAFGEAGLESICGTHPAYINFTKNLILELPPFNPSQFVIEILEDIQVDDALIKALELAKSQGSKLALDDFVLDHNSAPLLHLADIIKVDVLSLTEKQITRFAKAFIPRGMSMLAEKVETHEMFQFCKDLGFELFQGYFLSRPKIIEGHAIPENKLIVLRLLKELQDPDIDGANMSEILSQDPQMSYKLLKLVNSAAFVRVNKCTSLQQATATLGLDHIRRWASLLALGNLEDKPLALRQTSLERAFICQRIGERIAKTINQHSPSEFYTVGLFSLLAAFLDQPLLDIIKGLALPSSMEEGILHENGLLGLALHTAKCLQKNLHHSLKLQELEKYGIDPEALNELYTVAIKESDETMNTL